MGQRLTDEELSSLKAADVDSVASLQSFVGKEKELTELLGETAASTGSQPPSQERVEVLVAEVALVPAFLLTNAVEPGSKLGH